MTVAFIEGLRGGESLGPRSVAAMVKHFPGGGPQKEGRDAHDSRYREQVYPGHMQELHLKPFEAAFRAGVTQVMPYYGLPIGTDWPEVGFAFNRPVIQGLLRERYSFDGIVCTDWFLLESAQVGGHEFGPNGYGLEHLTPVERLKAALDAGVDQFGGDNCVEIVVELVEAGQLTEARLDQSVRRLLREKFRLGLFESRRVDGVDARGIVGSQQNRADGIAAQEKSLVLLSNTDRRTKTPILPLPHGVKVYAEGVGAGFDEALTPYGVRVGSPDGADVSIVRLDCPWDISDGPVGDSFHDGSLEFPAEVVERVVALAGASPTVVVVYLERPAVLTPFVGVVGALVGEFGADDAVLLRAVFGERALTGRLPFDLPASDKDIESSREDVPFDTSAPLYRFGHGLDTSVHEQFSA